MDLGAPGAKPFISTTFWELFWRPRGGKTDFGGQKPKIAKFLRIPQKIQFWSKKSGNCKIAANLPKRYLFCFKRLLNNKMTVIWRARGSKTPQWEENPEVSRNLVRFCKMLSFSRHFTIFAKRGSPCRNGSQIPMKTTRNTWCFGIAPRARTVFMEIRRKLENHWKSWTSWNFIKFH